MTNEQQLFFTTRLLEWYAGSHRPLPWKASKDVYTIWISEIILQQTRVVQGLSYFHRFMERFPSVEVLAAAPVDDVLKCWEGLGYYTRARNLHKAAGIIVRDYGGVFPRTYQQILALPGIGPYTAAAIASFAFDLPHAVVDGNVYRVLSRFTGVATPIDRPEGINEFKQLATRCLDTRDPATYNQAIMDFGATCCTPARPGCSRCPLADKCRAFQTDSVQALPVKANKIERKTRYFHYCLFNQEGRLWIRQRPPGDIWAGLYDFPCIETTTPLAELSLLTEHPQFQAWYGSPSLSAAVCSPPFRQQLTHQEIIACFWEINLAAELALPDGFVITERKKLSNFALPKVIINYLRQNTLYLNLH
jgi:A/G-specific adenine glycosylase